MEQMTKYLGFISMPGGGEWLVIAMFGLLLFGKRLPEVARSLGKSVTEFKKGLQGFEQEIDRSGEEQATLLLPPEQTSGGSALHDPAGRDAVGQEGSQVKLGP